MATLRCLLAASVIALSMLSQAVSSWACDVKSVIVKGRVEHSLSGTTVRVQLVYANGKPGESADITLDGQKFTLEIPFLTQSRAPVLLGRLMEKCDRKPTTVVVTLLGSDGQEHDRVSLSLPADFVMRDPSAYAVRNDLVLSGF